MKTSDKILLISSLSTIGIFGLVHLTLYARYERRDLLTENDLQGRRLAMMPAPHYLAIRGLLQTHIIPSDTFSIEFRNSSDDSRMIQPKQSKDADAWKTREPSYHREGDTLFIEGEKGRTVYRNNADQMIQWPFPVVNVYCRNLGLIEVNGGQVTLVGATQTAGAAGDQARLIVKNSILWVGQYHNWSDPVSPEFFDTLRIRVFNSTVLLNHLSVTSRLQANLADNSIIEDRGTDIGQSLEVGCDSTSKASFTGKNLQKLRPAGP